MHNAVGITQIKSALRAIDYDALGGTTQQSWGVHDQLTRLQDAKGNICRQTRRMRLAHEKSPAVAGLGCRRRAGA